MRRPATIALRLVAFAALVTGLTIVLAPLPATNSPYLSALTNLSGGTALAATHCSDKACGSFSGPCVSAPSYLCVGGGGTRQFFTRLCQ